MKLELIVEDAAINFADVIPKQKEIMLDVFKNIMDFEYAVDGVDPEDFKILFANSEPSNNYGGAFITSIYGSYLLHDVREEQKVCDEEDQTECTILLYSLTKISDQ